MGKPRLRTAGARWRLLVHERADGEYGRSHGIGPLDKPRDSEYGVHHDLPAATEFDELVVSHWCHIEQMDTSTWWMSIGGVTLWVTADRDGRPLTVTVYGPDDYADAVDGCRYECNWSAAAPEPATDTTEETDA